ncbi:hypothetical protein ACN27G_21835 [Plantactinospora sp. WMMB334]|uniref:hypothetical protein n=1 Tax=Plantactinospora sp. WMMB334 TaxID=3404119 RepID=UPI003B93AD3D
MPVIPSHPFQGFDQEVHFCGSITAHFPFTAVHATHCTARFVDQVGTKLWIALDFNERPLHVFWRGGA